MKKNQLLGVGLMATMLFAASCQNDDAVWQSNDGLATVELEVALPEIASSTRAAAQFGNGYMAQVLKYSVYEIIKKDGKDVDTIFLPNQEVREHDMKKQLSTNIALKLVPGSTYEIVFWAQHHKDGDSASPYTVNFNKSDGKTGVIAEVALDYAKLYTNNEINDAFWGKYRIEKVQLDGGSTVIMPDPVVLKRPFAQLNIGTADLKAAADAGFEVKEAAIVIPGGTKSDGTEYSVPNVLNLWTGEASRSNDQNLNKEYLKNELPSTDEWKFPVDGHEYMAMNYILADASKATLNKVTIKLYDANGREKTRDFNNVPVQRNWRTNIYGDLLTSDVSVQVKIDPLFADQNGVDDDNNSATNDKDEVYNENRNADK